MISLTIEIKNLAKINTLDRDIRFALRRGFYRFGKLLIRKTSKDILRKPRAGRLYIIRRGTTRRRHRASIPGEAPANISGGLRRSLNFLVRGFEEMTYGYSKVYGGWVEEGTKNMEARPGLKINIKKNQGKGRIFMEREIRRATGGR